MHELQLRHFRPSAVWKHTIKRTKKNTKETPGIVSLDGMVKAQVNCLLLFDSTIKITTLKYVLFGLFFPDDYSCNSTMQWNKNWKIFGFCSNGHKINIMLSHFYVLWLDYLLRYISLYHHIYWKWKILEELHLDEMNCWVMFTSNEVTLMVSFILYMV